MNSQLSLYRHFKGGLYVVIGIAKMHDDAKEDYVIYQKVGSAAMYIRPFEDFHAEVERDGQTMSRFTVVHSPA